MPAPDNVQWFGWELHCFDGNSDKFYRLLVTLTPSPAVIGIHGASGKNGSIGLLTADDDPKTVIRAAISKTRDKQKRYSLSRRFTSFEVPTALSEPGVLRANAHTISAYFGQAAARQSTEEPTASRIPQTL
ncbi:hypothetical protein [Streptomyces sp. NPDC055912]|uniref:hypothetical protein n=1 Tax=Streptomyces sp. NPDC055912 TaxID=3345660 RepID=UPI0035DE4694